MLEKFLGNSFYTDPHSTGSTIQRPCRTPRKSHKARVLVRPWDSVARPRKIRFYELYRFDVNKLVSFWSEASAPTFLRHRGPACPWIKDFRPPDATWPADPTSHATPLEPHSKTPPLTECRTAGLVCGASARAHVTIVQCSKTTPLGADSQSYTIQTLYTDVQWHDITQSTLANYANVVLTLVFVLMLEVISLHWELVCTWVTILQIAFRGWTAGMELTAYTNIRTEKNYRKRSVNALRLFC